MADTVRGRTQDLVRRLRSVQREIAEVLDLIERQRRPDPTLAPDVSRDDQEAAPVWIGRPSGLLSHEPGPIHG